MKDANTTTPTRRTTRRTRRSRRGPSGGGRSGGDIGSGGTSSGGGQSDRIISITSLKYRWFPAAAFWICRLWAKKKGRLFGSPI